MTSGASGSGSRPAGTQSFENLAYDPDMDVQEVRQIRSEYRGVLSSQAETRANLAGVKVSNLIEEVAQANSMFVNVKRAQEATLDSKVMTNLSEMAALKARNLKHSVGGFDVEDFLAKLMTFMGGQEGGGAVADDDDDDTNEGLLQWEKIGYMALKRSHRVTGVNFMLGPLSIQPKEKSKTTRVSHKLKKDPRQNIAPDEVDISKQQKKHEFDTAKMVAHLQALLEKQAAQINYFKFVINPNSFEQSVENIFYFAFLIKEGTAAWEIAENGEPLIYACERATQNDYQNDELRKKQVIAEFDVETWKRAIQVFNITHSIIPERPPVPPEEKYPNYTGNGSGGRRKAAEADDEDEDEDGEGEEEEVEMPSQDVEEDDDE